VKVLTALAEQFPIWLSRDVSTVIASVAKQPLRPTLGQIASLRSQ
jgi:hypothetical protein